MPTGTPNLYLGKCLKKSFVSKFLGVNFHVCHKKKGHAGAHQCREILFPKIICLRTWTKSKPVVKKPHGKVNYPVNNIPLSERLENSFK